MRFLPRGAGPIFSSQNFVAGEAVCLTHLFGCCSAGHDLVEGWERRRRNLL